MFVNCTVTGNVAGQKGGAIMTNGESGTTNVFCTLVNTTVTGNRLDADSKYGAGLFQHNTLSSIVNYNSIISGNTADGVASDIGRDSSVPDPILSYRCVVGFAVTDETATNVSGLVFNHSSMLGAFDYHGGSLTKCFPLAGDANPAATNGYSPAEMTVKFAGEDILETEYFSVDQTGASREGTASMGSCL